MPSSSAALKGHRVVAGSVALAIAALGFGAAPFSQVQLPAAPGFLPAFGALTMLTELLTATLLILQARLAADRAILRLGVTYLFSALALAPYLLAFSGAFAAAPLTDGGESAVWLWTFWHGGLAVGMIWSVAGRAGTLRPGSVVRNVAGVLAAVVALAVLATAGGAWLPRLLADGNFDRLNTLGIGPATLALTVVAEALVVVRLRLRNALSIWLAVSLLAAGLDVMLTLGCHGRFSFGWYVARGLSLATGLTMLVALLSDLIGQAGRASMANAQLEEMLRTDTLTGLYNRRAFEASLDVEWRRSRREQTAVSLLMIDIDLFKGFNDRHGHPAGDMCLRRVAAAIAGQIQRPADLAARIGGEEFVVLLPATEEAGAERVAERIRSVVAAMGVSYGGALLGRVTVSIGCATRRPSDRMAEAAALMDAADRALYLAKEAGRNRVCVESTQIPQLTAA